MAAPGGVADVDHHDERPTAIRGSDPQLRRGDQRVEHQQHVGLTGAEPVRFGVVPEREVEVAHDGAGLLRQSDLVEPPHLVAVEHRRGAEHLGGGDHAGAADADHADGDVVGIDGELGAARRRREERGDARWRDRSRAGSRCGPASVVAGADRGTRVSTVTNEGQSPSIHEKSRLHVVWSMWVLRPYAVSNGCTDRQLLISPQSPQPSQTRWLIATRRVGVGARPRLRARRSSAAHAWSWMRTVTPGTSARCSWASSNRSRDHT